MLYGIMPLRNQDKVKLNRCIFSIQRAYNNMINKQFKLIIFRDNDNSELPKIMFPHTVLESKVNKHILYGRLSMLELVKDDDYWFAIDSDDEISEDFLCNIEKEMDSNLDLITTSTIMDNGIVTKYITLNDIFINAYLHGLVFKKSIMKKNDIKLLYDLNDDYEFVDYGEDVIINMINIPNVKSFKHINGVYYYHNEDWFDIEFISKKYPKSEKIKFRRILEQLGYLYPNITTILYYSRKDINALWTDYGIELNPLISTITYEDVNVEKSLVDDKHRIEEAPNLRLVVPYIKNKGDLADKIISLIINIMYCCKQHTKFIVTNSGELQHNSIIGDDWLSYFFEPITMDFSDKFMNEYKLDRIRDIYVKKFHKAYNEIYKSFFKINKRVTDSLVKKKT